MEQGLLMRPGDQGHGHGLSVLGGKELWAHRL